MFNKPEASSTGTGGETLALAFFCALLAAPAAQGQTTCKIGMTNSSQVIMALTSTPSGCSGMAHNIDQPGVPIADPNRLPAGVRCTDRQYQSVTVTAQPTTEQGTIRLRVSTELNFGTPSGSFSAGPVTVSCDDRCRSDYLDGTNIMGVFVGTQNDETRGANFEAEQFDTNDNHTGWDITLVKSCNTS